MVERLKQEFHAHVLKLQQQILQKMQQLDPALTIMKDEWQRQDHQGNPGGGGLTCALKGKLFENAGVNTSCVYGKIDPKFAQQLPGSGDVMWAAGISLIIHPFNPKIPSVHANFRMIQQGEKCWFGGGADLTPYYPLEEDFTFFHQAWEKALKPYNLYPQMKAECDRYFVNHHRGQEMRGIGGIFFDHFNSGKLDDDFTMVKRLSETFIPSYFPIVEKRLNEKFTEADEQFQLYRRGRYVEFNLLHDRGTHFGLKTNGRTESILISLPARCQFGYNYQPESPIHQKMMTYYFAQDWL